MRFLPNGNRSLIRRRWMHFIHEYRDTIAFAKLTESDKVTSEVKDSGDEEGSETTFVPKVGDWVQWEHNGVLGLPEPKQIKGFSSDREWAYVDGQNGACPTRELIPESAPLNAKTLPAASLVQRQESLPKTYMQEFVVPLTDEKNGGIPMAEHAEQSRRG